MEKIYKKGLIIGKFIPPHKGHLKLIEFAARRAKCLIIAIYAQTGDMISGSLRFKWMKEMFGANENIKIVQIRTKLPQTAKPTKAASDVWCDYISKRFRDIDVVFSSEKYGKYLAEYMKIAHEEFDLGRKDVPVSAGKIRKNPIKYWNFIPKEIRPYFIKMNMRIENVKRKKK